MAHADPLPRLPIRLQIETTDICNMKCVMFTREVLDGMNTTTMSFEQFTNTVESIAPYYATFKGFGEPLDKLAASLPDMVTFSLDGATNTSYK